MHTPSPTFNQWVQRLIADEPFPQSRTRSTLTDIHSTLQRISDAQEKVQNTPPDQLMDINDVAAYLNVSVRTVEALIADGELVPLRVRSARRFTREGVEAYLRSTVRRS